MGFHVFTIDKQLGIVGNNSSEEPIEFEGEWVPYWIPGTHGTPLEPGRKGGLGWKWYDDGPFEPSDRDPFGGGGGGGGYDGSGVGGGRGSSSGRRWFPPRQRRPQGVPAWAENLWVSDTDLSVVNYLWNKWKTPSDSQKKKIIKALKDIVQFDCIKEIPGLEECLERISIDGKTIGIDSQTACAKGGGYYDELTKTLYLCPNKINDHKELRSIIIHELLHACGFGEGGTNEFIIEVLEHICNPDEKYVDQGYRKLGTLNLSDPEPRRGEFEPCYDIAGRRILVGEYFIWNPETGEVWIRGESSESGGNTHVVRGKKVLPKGDSNPFKITDKTMLSRLFPDNFGDFWERKNKPCLLWG